MRKINILIFFLLSFQIFAQIKDFILFTPSDIGIENGSIVRAIHLSRDKSVWFGTQNSGLIKYKNENWIIYDSTNSPFKNLDSWAISSDSLNNIYIATAWDSGLVKLDISGNWEFTNMMEIIPQLEYNAVWDVEVAQNGDIWVGTYWGGFAKYDGFAWTYFNSTNSPMDSFMDEVNAIKEDYNGNIWFGTDAGGAGRLNKDSTWTLLLDINWWVYTIEIEKNGDVWFIGKDVRKLTNNEFIFYDIERSRFSNNAMAIDSNNIKWFPNIDGDGLIRFDDNEFQYIDFGVEDTTLGEPWSIAIDSYDNKWIGYSSGHIAVYNENGIVSDIKKDVLNISNDFQLSQNYPNPFNPSTTIRYSIPNNVISNPQRDERSLVSEISPFGQNDNINVKLIVYDILGREVKTLVNELKHPGSYEIEFDASKLTSGVYYYQLKAADFIQTKKMILLQ